MEGGPTLAVNSSLAALGAFSYQTRPGDLGSVRMLIDTDPGRAMPSEPSQCVRQWRNGYPRRRLADKPTPEHLCCRYRRVSVLRVQLSLIR